MHCIPQIEIANKTIYIEKNLEFELDITVATIFTSVDIQFSRM